MSRPTVDQALQVARDVDIDGLWMREGAPPELTPETVEWLAALALHHPQVSAAVAAALPSSGVRWAGVWVLDGDGLRQSLPGGEMAGQIQPRGAETWTCIASTPPNAVSGATREGVDAARAEVYERLIAAGYTQLGAVYRRVQCGDCHGKGRFSPWGKPSSDPTHRACLSCDGAGMVLRG